MCPGVRTAVFCGQQHRPNGNICDKWKREGKLNRTKEANKQKSVQIEMIFSVFFFTILT